jgi:hypothetical protein
MTTPAITPRARGRSGTTGHHHHQRPEARRGRSLAGSLRACSQPPVGRIGKPKAEGVRNTRLQAAFNASCFIQGWPWRALARACPPLLQSQPDGSPRRHDQCRTVPA